MTKAKIMIVEDEAIVAREIKAGIENMGYSVASISSRGEEAIEKVQEDRPDLILMDIQLKGQMDGIEAADIIESRFGIPVIFLTAYDDDERLKRAKSTLPYGYVLKPFRDRDLRITIEMGLYAAEMNAWRIRAEAQARESQKMEAIATLAGGVAHEFNNALSSITGHTGLLEMEYPEDPKIMDYAKAMKQSAHRMVRLTSQLLAYARGGKYNSQTISPSKFVEGALPSIRHILDPDIRVETYLPLDVMSVEVDRTQVQMVLSAIFANSNEAIDPPGHIRISTRNIDLDQEFIKDHPELKPGPYVCLSIKDDGKGMDEDTRRKIFDPFFTTHFMGRGLGMASVYGIIKNHDGTITVESEPGKGTVVRIYLPAISAESREQEEKVIKQPKVEIAMGEGTILVIEDEKPLVDLFRQILERLGYRVLVAETGKEAVDLAKTFDGQIDLALLDIKLPDMDGGRVYPLIMETRPDLKVIVCSGYSIHGPAQKILDAGAEGFIQKPFSIAPFAEKLKEVLEGK